VNGVLLRSRPRKCAISSSMEVLVEVRPLRRFSLIESRRLLRSRGSDGGSPSILDAVDTAFVSLFGNQIEAELFAYNTREKAAH
jgi:hypothetical protein